MSVSLFSSSAEVAIAKSIVILDNVSRTLNDELSSVYELNACARWICDNNFSRVALQFSDKLLVDSAAIYQFLESSTQRKFFILGDTTYGSCCVDEIAAEHASCDSIIHFGSSCLSPSNRLPVALIFPNSSHLEFSDCAEKLSFISDISKNIVFLFDTEYLSLAVAIKQKFLEGKFSRLVIPQGQTVLSEKDISDFIFSEDNNVAEMTIVNKRLVPSPMSESTENNLFVFIGSSGPCMVNLCIQLPSSKFYHYDPAAKTIVLESQQINKRVMRRNFLIEQAKDAKIVGILIGTLGVKGFLGIIERLKSVIRAAGKRFYTFAMGKPNPAKLANFMEVDVFVYVACSESYFDSKEYLRPIVTPHEMEIACCQRVITEGFVPDFRELLPGGRAHVPINHSVLQVEPDVSLIRGNSRTFQTKEESYLLSTDLVLVDQVLTMATQVPSASEFLSSRSWKGLEPEYGMSAPADVVEGRHGIATSYQEEAPYSTKTSGCEGGCCKDRNGLCEIESEETLKKLTETITYK